MLKEKVKSYFDKERTSQTGSTNTVMAFKEEFEYAKKHQLIDEDIILVAKDPFERFSDIYIERSDKETEEMLGEESVHFLEQPINYLKKHKHQFIYIESEWFERIGADSLSLEVDDVFGTYEVMLGLKLPKKYENTIKTYLHHQLTGEIKYSLLFNNADGLWDFNFALDNTAEFNENMTIGETLCLVYRFLFSLVQAAEEGI